MSAEERLHPIVRAVRDAGAECLVEKRSGSRSGIAAVLFVTGPRESGAVRLWWGTTSRYQRNRRSATERPSMDSPLEGDFTVIAELSGTRPGAEDDDQALAVALRCAGVEQWRIDGALGERARRRARSGLAVRHRDAGERARVEEEIGRPGPGSAELGRMRRAAGGRAVVRLGGGYELNLPAYELEDWRKHSHVALVRRFDFAIEVVGQAQPVLVASRVCDARAAGAPPAHVCENVQAHSAELLAVEDWRDVIAASQRRLVSVGASPDGAAGTRASDFAGRRVAAEMRIVACAQAGQGAPRVGRAVVDEVRARLAEMRRPTGAGAGSAVQSRWGWADGGNGAEWRCALWVTKGTATRWRKRPRFAESFALLSDGQPSTDVWMVPTGTAARCAERGV